MGQLKKSRKLSSRIKIKNQEGKMNKKSKTKLLTRLPNKSKKNLNRGSNKKKKSIKKGGMSPQEKLDYLKDIRDNCKLESSINDLALGKLLDLDSSNYELISEFLLSIDKDILRFYDNNEFDDLIENFSGIGDRPSLKKILKAIQENFNDFNYIVTNLEEYEYNIEDLKHIIIVSLTVDDKDLVLQNLKLQLPKRASTASASSAAALASSAAASSSSAAAPPSTSVTTLKDDFIGLFPKGKPEGLGPETTTDIIRHFEMLEKDPEFIAAILPYINGVISDNKYRKNMSEDQLEFLNKLELMVTPPPPELPPSLPSAAVSDAASSSSAAASSFSAVASSSNAAASPSPFNYNSHPFLIHQEFGNMTYKDLIDRYSTKSTEVKLSDEELDQGKLAMSKKEFMDKIEGLKKLCSLDINYQLPEREKDEIKDNIANFIGADQTINIGPWNKLREQLGSTLDISLLQRETDIDRLSPQDRHNLWKEIQGILTAFLIMPEAPLDSFTELIEQAIKTKLNPGEEQQVTPDVNTVEGKNIGLSELFINLDKHLKKMIRLIINKLNLNTKLENVEKSLLFCLILIGNSILTIHGNDLLPTFSTDLNESLSNIVGIGCLLLNIVGDNSSQELMCKVTPDYQRKLCDIRSLKDIVNETMFGTNFTWCLRVKPAGGPENPFAINSSYSYANVDNGGHFFSIMIEKSNDELTVHVWDSTAQKYLSTDPENSKESAYKKAAELLKSLEQKYSLDTIVKFIAHVPKEDQTSGSSLEGIHGDSKSFCRFFATLLPQHIITKSSRVYNSFPKMMTGEIVDNALRQCGVNNI